MDSAEFESVLSAVRGLIRKDVVPLEEAIDRDDEVPPSIHKKAAEMGLFGFALPEEYGGFGFSMSEDVRLAVELGYTTLAFRSMFGTNNGIAGQVLANFATPEQKQKYLPRMASGDLIASFALTEPEAGSDPSGIRTRAERTAEGYVINGQKRYITNADHAGLFIVFARVAGEAPSSKGIAVFAVEREVQGVTVGPPDEKMGQRGAHTAEVIFEDVKVGHDALVGGDEEHGFVAAMRSVTRGRLHVAALSVGMAKRLVEESVQHAATSRQGSQVLADFQLVQGMVADSYTECAAGEALVLQAARAYDEGTDTRIGPSAAKLFCTEMVGRVADRAVQIHGGMGYMRSVPAERFYRDARLLRIYEGTSEVQRVIIAKQLRRASGL